MHPKLTQIHLLQTMNTYLKKSPAALHSLYLHLSNLPTLRTLQQHYFPGKSNLTITLRVRSYIVSYPNLALAKNVVLRRLRTKSFFKGKP